MVKIAKQVYFAALGAMAAGLAIAPTHARAQPVPNVTDAMLECRKLEKNKDRLACFDRVMTDAFGVDEVIEERRTSDFGLPEREVRDEGVLEAVITAIALDPSMGLGRVTLDNGQVWQTTSNGSLLPRLRTGQTVTIARGGFSGYRLRVEGITGYQGVRRSR